MRVEAARRQVSKKAMRTALDLSYSAMTRRLSGEVEWSLGQLATLAALFGIPLSQLIGTDDANESVPA